MNTDIPIKSAFGVPASETPTPKRATGESEMGKEQFLELLTAQLQHQDPLEPLKNHEFVAQLAQFSGLEQQITVNENLQALKMSQTSMANGQLSSLIGKDVVSKGGRLQVDTGSAQPLEFELGASASRVMVTIKDENNQSVATKDLGTLHQGSHTIPWDGQNNQGVALPPGSYHFEIQATDANENPVTANAKGRGKVTGVTFEKGYPELIIGQGKILPADIVEILSTQDFSP